MLLLASYALFVERWNVLVNYVFIFVCQCVMRLLVCQCVMRFTAGSSLPARFCRVCVCVL